MILLNATHEQSHYSVTHYKKIFPHHEELFIYRESFDKKVEGYEQQKATPSSIKQAENSSQDNPSRSLRRTKTVISDYTKCNEFDLFVTFTFKEKRQDQQACRRRMKKWLKNQRDIHGQFQYLIVPEFHKDNISLHFHALIKNYKGKLTDSGKKINKRKAYNIKSYKLGFSTAVYIDNTEKVANYIKKYITKDMILLGNKNRYFCSKNLNRPIKTYNVDLSTTLLNNPLFILNTSDIYRDILNINTGEIESRKCISVYDLLN